MPAGTSPAEFISAGMTCVLISGSVSDLGESSKEPDSASSELVDAGGDGRSVALASVSLESPGGVGADVSVPPPQAVPVTVTVEAGAVTLCILAKMN